MRLRLLAIAFALGALAIAPACVQRAQEEGGEEKAALSQEKGGEEEFGPYEVVPDWPKPFPGQDAEWGSDIVPGVFAESPDRVFIITVGNIPKKGGFSNVPSRGADGAPVPPKNPGRRQNFVLVVNRNGEVVENWSQWDSLWGVPQWVGESPYDPERRVWITDNLTHQVLVFSNDGKKLLMRLGEPGKIGTDQSHFDGPADVAWFPDGTFLVSDGYQNTRLVKFDKNGKYLMEWGTKGSAPGQMDFVHGVAIGADRRVYQVDRRNHRIQVFDENGKFLDLWPDIRSPCRVVPTSDGAVWVLDCTTTKILKYDRDGHLLYSWGTGGTYPGAFRSSHAISVDQEGTVYVADCCGGNNRVLKFTPKKNADKGKLVQRPVGFSPMK